MCWRPNSAMNTGAIASKPGSNAVILSDNPSNAQSNEEDTALCLRLVFVRSRFNCRCSSQGSTAAHTGFE